MSRFALALCSLALFFVGSFASAKISFPANYCAWAPGHPEVCQARKFCKGNPRNAHCAVYCHVNPRDTVCGDVYQPALEPTAPYTGDTPYPWARTGGGFCEQNPGNIGCQGFEDLPFWGQ